MLDFLHLARGAFTGINPFRYGLNNSTSFALIPFGLTELSFPLLYLKSVFTEDLFGYPQCGSCCCDEASLCLEQASAPLQDKCAL